jgi:pimeloyl-ACP methyl ester carboxylesterase
MAQIQLSAGVIDYQDTGGDGVPIVLLHGLLMDASLWDAPISVLSADHRCVAPTLPMGGHALPVGDGADLSLSGLATLVGELIERLELTDVTLVGSDTGGALVQLLVSDSASVGIARVRRVVLVSCEAFDNLPARVTGTTLALAGWLPPWLFGLFMLQLRLRPVRRLPVAFGWLTAQGDAVTARWVRAVLAQSAVRHDAVRVLRSIRAARSKLLDAAERLHTFTGPALVVWARGDRVMPSEHGRRLAALFPRGQVVEVDRTRSLISLDQPQVLARLIADFIGTSTGS